MIIEQKTSKNEQFYDVFGRTIKSIKDDILLGDFWGKGKAISFQKQLLKLVELYRRWHDSAKLIFSIPVELFSMASSTYYAASGNAASRIKEEKLFFKPLWYWRAWMCLQIAEKNSDKFAKLRPMNEMSLGELDTRACVLNKAGRLSEAIVLLRHGIDKISTEQVGNKHDLCLFLIHEAEVFVGMKKYLKDKEAEENYKQAMKLSEDEIAPVPILTRVRVMKSYGKFLTGVGRAYEAKNLLNEVYWLAEENGLYDQAVKIKALLAGIK